MYSILPSFASIQLRDVNGSFMHNGSLNTLMDVVNHYNELEEVSENTNLDFRLSGNMHHLELTEMEKETIVAFLGTLTGVGLYTAERWSNPFDLSTQKMYAKRVIRQ